MKCSMDLRKIFLKKAGFVPSEDTRALIFAIFTTIVTLKNDFVEGGRKNCRIIRGKTSKKEKILKK
jgi:hypothetical protein